MYLVFKGKAWAKNVLIILFSLAAIMAIISLFSGISLPNKSPLIVMSMIYSLAVYHLNFSKSFKEFFAYLNTKV